MNHTPTPARLAALLAAAALASPALGQDAAPSTRPAVPASAVTPGDATAADRAQRLIDSGLAYLEQQQKPDGGWQADRDPPAITALAVRAFVLDPAYSVDDPVVERGLDKLLSYQVADGGIYQDLLANYNTAIAVSALSAANDRAGDGRYDERIGRAVAYLKGLQWTPDTRPEYDDPTQGQQIVTGEADPFYGGWGYGGRSRGAGRPDLSNAQVTLEALHDAGVPPTDPAFERAMTFVTRLQNRSESNPQSWAGDDGGFVYGPAADRQGESMAGDYLAPDGDRRLRSYGSMTYAGLKSMVYAGLTADDPRARAAFDWATRNWTLDENPGMAALGPDKAQNGLYYYYLTVARAMDAIDRPTFAGPSGETHDWRVELVDQLSALQNADGSWAGDKRWFENNPLLVTSYAVQALQAARADLEQHPPTR